MQFSYVKLIYALAVIFGCTGRCACETPPEHDDVQLVENPTGHELGDNIPTYTCSVFYKKEGIASGIILTESHVLTTCNTVIIRKNKFMKAEDVEIVRGTFHSVPEEVYIVSQSVKSITPHPQCISRVFDNWFDLAIIETKEPIFTNQYSGFAELSSQTALKGINKPWFLSNFRADYHDATTVKDTVWMVKTTFVKNDICEDPSYYDSSFDPDHHFCAGYDHENNVDSECPGKILLQRRGIRPPGPANRNARAPEWNTIEQRVDHFNPTDSRTWQMRYMNNSQHFTSGGPMFIFLGGEWEISAGYLTTGQMYDMAETHGGYMFYTEHRYYGDSFPTPDLSSDNLRYLSADQALADLAYFIQYQQQTIPGLLNSKVVVTGGSYSGSLATWAREKYPHLIDIGYASSAPLRAVADFFEYYEVVNDNLALADPQCVATLRNATAEIEANLETGQGQIWVSDLFNTCGVIQYFEPYRSFFFNLVAEIFAGLVQYAEVGQLESECNVLMGHAGTPMEKLATYVKDAYEGECMGDYDEFLSIYKSTNLTNDATRSWYYQTCTEYGYYQTTTSDNQPFGDTFPITLFYTMCFDLYGVRFTSKVIETAVNRTNIVYGSVDPDITNVISIHGTVDPWHAIGLTKDLSPAAPVIIVNGTSHTEDLGSISVNDIPEMQAAKSKVQEMVSQWLQQ